MTSQNRGGDDSSRRTQRGNNGNQEARDLEETGRFEDDMGQEPGAGGGRKGNSRQDSDDSGSGTGHDRRNDRNSKGSGDRGVGNNTDGVVGSGGDEGFGTRDNG